MRSSVAARFRAFNEPFEGVVKFMYLDVKGLVTIGVGNLIDPMSVALALPFRFKAKPGAVGRLATRAEIEAEWRLIKGFFLGWINFHAACERMDFENAAANCKIREAGNPGVVPRNRANVHLFRNAAAVLAGEAERSYRREELYYPRVLLKPPEPKAR